MEGQKTYKAFTLIEMLIVMGILIILMVVGVAAGRFAINRANEIANRNGATQIYQALQAHYTDYGKYPIQTTDFTTMLNAKGNQQGVNTISQYLDMGAFSGKDATYSYFTNVDAQAVLVCVTLGGFNDEGHKGVICAGNGFKDSSVTINHSTTGTTIDSDKYEYVSDNSSVYYSIASKPNGNDITHFSKNLKAFSKSVPNTESTEPVQNPTE